MKIIIGSRGSDLALWQAHFVTDQLNALGHEVELKIIETKGDRIQDLSFDKIEGKGFFTKEIEEALLNQEIDLAVHSHKDLETTNPVGLIIGAVSYRENPTDQLLVRKESFDPSKPLQVKKHAIIGTSSARRKSQVIRMREDIQLKDLRGNVPTRVDKLRPGQYDAIILATAGLKRLNLDLSEFELISKRCLSKEGIFKLELSTDKTTITVFFLNWIDQFTINWLFTEAAPDINNKIKIFNIKHR
jgi:hydroxymethylbilane synthase